MIDVEKILNELKSRAGELAESVDADTRLEDAKEMARKVKTRIETDENTRNAAIGGGALLALLMATGGGRKLIGGVAKTGAVAALGAVAYKAWQDRSGSGSGGAETDEETLAQAGFVTGDATDPDFSLAIIQAMAAAANADGAIDAAEMEAIDKALKDAGADASALATGLSREEILLHIASAARTPNHAAQLYAAASLGAADPSMAESDFLTALASKLGVNPDHARLIQQATN